MRFVHSFLSFNYTDYVVQRLIRLKDSYEFLIGKSLEGFDVGYVKVLPWHLPESKEMISEPRFELGSSVMLKFYRSSAT